MVPENWSTRKVMEVFEVSDIMLREANELEKIRVCSLPPPHQGNALSDETKQVTSFFQNNKCSRITPGMKGRVSDQKNAYEQKS